MRSGYGRISGDYVNPFAAGQDEFLGFLAQRDAETRLVEDRARRARLDDEAAQDRRTGREIQQRQLQSLDEFRDEQNRIRAEEAKRKTDEAAAAELREKTIDGLVTEFTDPNTPPARKQAIAIQLDRWKVSPQVLSPDFMQPKKDKPISVAPGGYLVDPETGKQVYHAPDRPQRDRGPVSVAPGSNLVDPDTGRVLYTAPERKPTARDLTPTDVATLQQKALEVAAKEFPLSDEDKIGATPDVQAYHEEQVQARARELFDSWTNGKPAGTAPSSVPGKRVAAAPPSAGRGDISPAPAAAPPAGAPAAEGGSWELYPGMGFNTGGGGAPAPAPAASKKAGAPTEVSALLKNAGPGRYTLSDGTVWLKDANGNVTAQ